MTEPEGRHRTSRLSVARATIGSLAAAFSAQLLLAFTGIVAARRLGVEERGDLALLILLPTIASSIGLSVPVAATYFIARAPETAEAVVRKLRRPAFVQTGILFALHVSLLAATVRGLGSSVLVAAVVTLPAVPLLLGQLYALAVLQGRRAFRPYNVLRVGPVALYAISVVILIVIDRATLTGFALAWIGATAASTLATSIVAIRHIPRGVDAAQTASRSEMLRFGRRALLGTTSPIEYFQADQAIAAFALSQQALGLYVVGLAPTNLVRFCGQSLGMVAYPTVAASRASARRRTLWRFALVAVLVGGAVVIPLEVAAGWLIPLLFGNEFVDAVPVTRLLLLSAFLFSVRRVLTEAARGAGFVGVGTFAEVVSWGTLAVSALVLVPAGGLEGLTIAMVITGAISLAAFLLALARGGRHQTSAGGSG